MNLKRVGVLAPCEGITDFPTFYLGADAAGLHAAWTAAWLPGVIAASGRIPEIVSTYEPPPIEPWADGLLIAPEPSVTDDTLEWLDSVRAARPDGARVLEGFADRTDLIAALTETPHGIERADASIEQELFALAYAYLQVAKLTGEMTYGSVFDPNLFEESVVAAARAGIDGRSGDFEPAMRRAYDQLEQARNYRYPVSISLLEVLLTAEEIPDESLEQGLESVSAGPDRRSNLLITGQHLERIAARAPACLATLRRLFEAGKISILAGGYTGADLSLMSPEAMHDELLRSQDVTAKHLGAAPRVFGQFRGSCPPRLPRLLNEFDFSGALLIGFDGTDPPMTDHGRTTWVGIDGSRVEAAVAAPRDVGKPETLLGLADHLSETLERDHTATLVLAGWPGASDPAMQDLLTVARRSDVLGRFVTLDEYFEQTTVADHWGHVESDTLGPNPHHAIEPPDQTAPATSARDRLARGVNAFVDDDSRSPHATAEGVASVLSALRLRASPEPAPHRVAFNPWSFAVPCNTGVAVPAVGYIADPPEALSDTKRVEGLVLRNERLEAQIHPETGGLRSLRTHGTRTNQVSQRLLVVRSRGALTAAAMRVESIETVGGEGQGVGAIRSRGTLVDARGEPLARFEQRLALAAGAEWLHIDARVDRLADAPDPAPGEACVARFALPDSEWTLRRGLQWAGLPVGRRSFVAGDYVEMGDPGRAVTVGCGSPTRFRRVGGRLFDAIVPSHGRAQFAVSLRSTLPMRTALAGFAGVLHPPAAPAGAEDAMTGGAGWWLHVDATNVLISRIEADPNRPRGFRLRLVETEGRATAARIRAFRPLVLAEHESFRGAPLGGLPIADGAATIEIGAYGWLQLAAAW